MTLYLVIDQRGFAQPCPSFEEAKDKFEHMCGTCRQTNAFNSTFRSKSALVKVDDCFIKQFSATYKSGKGFWITEIYSLQKITLQ